MHGSEEQGKSSSQHSRFEKGISPSMPIQSTLRKESKKIENSNNIKDNLGPIPMESTRKKDIPQPGDIDRAKVNKKRDLTPERKSEEISNGRSNYIASKSLMLTSRGAPKIKRLDSENS